MAIAKTLLRALRYVWPDGSYSLDPIHMSLIDSVLRTLPLDQAEVVRNQLSQKYFVQWMSGGRINAIFFDHPENVPLLDDKLFADKLFRVDLFIDGKKNIAHVTFYKQRIFSVELKIPRKFYKGKEYRVGAVTEGKAKDSFTAVIDHASHGKETETNHEQRPQSGSGNSNAQGEEHVTRWGSRSMAMTLTVLSLALSAPAFAQCTVPNVLTNGQVADATEVMDNFNAVAECADDVADAAVEHSGTPQAGEIAVFDGTETITGGHLTGDVTASGGTATTLATARFTALGNFDFDT